MISWRDAHKLTLKRNRRKRVFGGLKYGAPLFCIILLTIVTLNVVHVVGERVQNKLEDREYPYKSHLVIKTPGDYKTQKPMTQEQIKSLRNHPATQEMMTHYVYFDHHYFDMGEVRFNSNSALAGYSEGFFNLYRILPPEKSDPTSIPALLGRDLLSLTWSPELKSFTRNEKEEMKRWLGRTITVYINPLGTEYFDDHLKLSHLDYQKHRAEIINSRKLKLEELNRTKPDIASRQDAVFIKLQVVGFIRDQLDYGSTTVIPADICNQILDIAYLSRDKKQTPPSEDTAKSAQLLAKPGKEKELGDFVRSIGLELKDKGDAGLVAKLVKEIKNDPEARLGLFMTVSTYFVTVMIIIYQLLGGQVKDAVREIGLLRCIGARRMDIMRIFMMMNLLRLARIYMLCVVSAYLLLLGAGYWSAGKLNIINPENLAKGNIPEFLINRIDNFSPFWLMGPSWMAFAPLLLLIPIALCAAAIPIWHAMGVQPSEALKD